MAPASGQVLEVDNESARSLPAGSQSDDDRRSARSRHRCRSRLDRRGQGRRRRRGHASPDGAARRPQGQGRRIEPIGFTKVSALGVEEQRVRVSLDITSPPELWASLGHLYRVFAAYEVERYDDAVLVPISALFRDGADWACYVCRRRNGAAAQTDARCTRRSFAVVTDGAQAAGDRVILHPSDQIVDGRLIVDRATMRPARHFRFDKSKGRAKSLIVAAAPGNMAPLGATAPSRS